MQLPANLTQDQIVEAAQSGDYVGFCLACGEQADCVEPDARNYTCEACGEDQVFGAEELIIMTNGWL